MVLSDGDDGNYFTLLFFSLNRLKNGNVAFLHGHLSCFLSLMLYALVFIPPI